MIIVLKKTADDAWAAFKPYQNKFLPYRDATMGTCAYKSATVYRRLPTTRRSGQEFCVIVNFAISLHSRERFEFT